MAADWQWYSICSKHQGYDESCDLCRVGHWQNETDPAVIADRALWESDPDGWREKHRNNRPLLNLTTRRKANP